MTRKFLEDLGLEKDLIDKILDENSRDIGKAKGNYDDIKTERDQLKDEIEKRDKQLTELKKLDPEGLKDEIQRLQEENDKAKAKYEADLKAIKVENAIEKALTGAGAKNIKAVKALLDIGDAELDGETVKGLDDQIKKLTESDDSKFLFNISDGGPDIKGAKPGERGEDKSKGIKNPWSKEHWNLTEQGKMLRENPDLAKQLKNA